MKINLKFFQIPLIAILFFGSNAIAQTNIIGNPIKIGSLEVAQNQRGSNGWDDAKKICSELGGGWRLPTVEELTFMFKYKDKIGNISPFSSYWTSKVDSDEAFAVSGGGDGYEASFQITAKNYALLVRPVRNSINNNESSKVQINGEVNLTFPNGSKYVGTTKDGKRNGQGTETFPSGDIYIGEWRDNKKNGKGTYLYKDGSKYIGDFKDNLMTGQATYTSKNGSIRKGSFEDGVYIGEKNEVKVQNIQSNNNSTASSNVPNTRKNSGNSNSNTVQNCNIKFQVPTLPFKYIDNRELCIYCRERYIPYRKIDVNDAKKNRTVSYVVKQVDNHCENVGADNDCKASHMEQITNLFVNNGYYKSFVDAFEAVQMREGVGNLISTYTESIGNLFSSILGGGATNENKDNEFEINLYENNNTKFCTREHEDRYNKKY